VAVIAAQAARIEQLEKLVGELAARLAKDSSNSSKPPGSDGPGSRAERRAVAAKQKKQRQAERDAGGSARKRGGQAGHEGRGLELSADPDRREAPSEPAACDGCGGDLVGAKLVGREKLQVVDIPEIKALVTEYLLVSRRCGCGVVSCGQMPVGVRGGPVAYGPNLQARAALLHAHGQLSQERAAEPVAGLFGVDVSAGWIGKVADRLAASLAGFHADLGRALLAEPVLLGDETPVNAIEDSPETEEQLGRSFVPYVFTFRTPEPVWLSAGHTRGHAALDAFEMIDRYTGTFVSDDYGGYSKYEANLAARRLCNAHLIRSLRGIADGEPLGQRWATDMIGILKDARQTVIDAENAGLDALTGGQIAAIRARYLACARQGVSGNFYKRTGKGTKIPALVLAQRLLAKIDQVLHHLSNFAVPWTSNLAEQALRHVKIHLKISGCFRTLATTRAYCRIQSYLATTRLQHIPAMDAIRAALAGHAWSPLT
jgi:transposase